MRPLFVVSALLTLSCSDKPNINTYNTAPTATISLPADGSVFPAGEVVTFTGVVKDNQQDPDTLSLSWTSDQGGLLNDDPSDSEGIVKFSANGLSVGEHLITLLAIDEEGISSEDWTTLTVSDSDDAPTLTIVSPEEDDVGYEFEEYEFEAYVDDEQDNASSLVFGITSDLDDDFCDVIPLPNGVVQCDAELSVGVHTLLFAVEDTDGNVATGSAIFEVISGDAVDDDGDGFSEDDGDCDDSDDDIYPEADEALNSEDDDCDTLVDEGTANFDDDLDGYSEIEGDCDDTDPDVYEGAEEDCDGVDDDCDTDIDEGTDCDDSDGDGFSEGDGDCDDTDDDIYPDADETLDGLDNDCDELIDEGTDAYDDDGDCYCEEAPCEGSVEETCKTVEGGDCNDDPDDDGADFNPDVNEICDGVDNNCDGDVDEDSAADAAAWFADTDYDGFGDAADAWYACDQPPGYVGDDTDCDDTTNAVNPDATESCDELDNDCDLSVDEGVLTTFYADADEDDYGDLTSTTEACEAPDGYTADATDCDDTDPAYNPGASEDDCTDPNDYNCDGAVGYSDGDGDGFAACEECDDLDPDVNPDAAEVCDDIDNNCDGDIDEALTEIFYADSDTDGYGNPSSYAEACEAPEGFVDNNEDCNDNSSAANPGEDEVCDNVDNNCDGIVDEDSALDASTWYDDDDSDGYGDAGDTMLACNQPAGFVASDTDCDDGVASINPGASEACNGADDDCDTDIDEGVTSTFYADYDSDEFGDASVTDEACSAPTGFVDNDGDCDDTTSAIYPGATEICDGVDNNCDGNADEDSAADAAMWYADVDEDSYGDAADTTESCEQPDSYVANASDCDDNDGGIYPGASEVCDDVDQDCDSDIDEGVLTTYFADSDSDGYGDPAETEEACSTPANYTLDNTDCDDGTGAANPGESESCDSIDNDCDAVVDEDGAVDADTWYYDSDSDGYGDAAISDVACDQPASFVASSTDCDDGAGAVNPGATESCNEIDDDCDTSTDEGVTDTFYADFDSDDFGDAAETTEACEAPANYVEDASDCDDSNGATNPDATEVCDSQDNDCDSGVDEDATDDATWYADGDEDGYGDVGDTIESCAQPLGYVSSSTDCDDDEAGINPGASESCDDVDEDCDGDIDEGVLTTYFADDDSDGFGDAADTEEACSLPSGFAANDDDCNDGSDSINPDADETCDNVDNDCDVSVDEASAVDAGTWYEDDDSDGYGNAAVSQVACDQPASFVSSSTDCDDTEAGVNPGASEACDDVDQDCDSDIDEGVTDTFYADFDGDDFGDAAETVEACSEPGNYVSDATDCDDSDGGVNPDATEYCDDVDNNCDGVTDEDSAADAATWYADDDNDSYGDADEATVSCESVTGYVASASDCDDGDGGVYPGATEVCDDADQDCDSAIDEGVLTTYYLDDDSDGFGDASVTAAACSQPTGYADNDNDCNDNSAVANPDETEVCDNLDNNCDGNIDENSAADATTWYEDDDSDGYGNAAVYTVACDQPASYVASDSDCDDTEAGINPGTAEACDGEDDDCDTVVDEDVESTWYLDDDGDGYGDGAVELDDCDPPDGYVSNRGDCDDADADINPDTVWYRDFDGDTYGTPSTTQTACNQPGNYVLNDEDCGDLNADRYPGADEYCNGEDDDCDDDVDETNAIDCVDWYYDGDNDGFGTTEYSCECGSSGNYRAENDDDCYDSNSQANPDQTSWFSVDRGDGSFDYDCNGNQQRHYTNLYECDVDITGLSCSDTDGWNGAVASCGDSEVWKYDGCNLICVSPSSFSRTQGCH